MDPCRFEKAAHGPERAFICFRLWVWAMERRFLAVQQKANTRTAPFRTHSTQRQQERLDFRPPHVGADRLGKDRFERAPVLCIRLNDIMNW